MFFVSRNPSGWESRKTRFANQLYVLGIQGLDYNGYVYETFGISKHFPVKLQVPLIRAEMLDNPLTAKCFIYDVVRSAFLSIIHWFAINFNNFHILIQQFSTLFSFQN